MSTWKQVIKRVFGRGHPDVYGAMKEYAESKGIDVTDAIASACAAYMTIDDEGKEKLETAMAERRKGGGGGKADMTPAINMFKEMCGAMGEMFKAMNESRASLQSASLISDYKAVTQAASEIKKIGGESGGGSLEDKIAEIFLDRMLGGKIGSLKSTKKTGTDKVEEVKE